MRNERAAGSKPVTSEGEEVLSQMHQMLMPMVAGIASTKAELTSWVHAQGLAALNAVAAGRGGGASREEGQDTARTGRTITGGERRVS